MTETEKLNQALKAKQPRRVMVYMEVLENGKWVWELYSSTEGTAELAPPPAVTARPKYDRPKVQGSRPTSPPFTMGRDPSQFLLTFGRFYKENGYQPIKLEMLDETELNGWLEKMREAEDPSPQLEVAMEMIEAYLIDKEFVPEINKKKRRA